MTDAELFAILRPIILVTGVPECILANPNAPAPVGAYATIQIRQPVTERGQANIYRANKQQTVDWVGVETDVRSQIVCSCSVNFWRGEATMFAEKIKQINKRPDVSLALFKAKIGWAGTEAVNNLNAIQSNNWEQRAQMTIKLWYETSNKATINAIYSASLAVENESGDVLVTVPFNP